MSISQRGTCTRGGEPSAMNVWYRPSHFVADWSPIAAIVQDIVGDARREWVRQRLAAGALRPPMDHRLLASHLSPALRERWVARNPMRNIAGEYLPPYEPGEHEVARVVVNTTPRTVYSVRARQYVHAEHGELMSICRIVGEPGTTFDGPSLESHGMPPAMALNAVINSSRPSKLMNERPLSLSLPELLVRAYGHASALERQQFVRVESFVYPGLERYYQERVRRWVAADNGMRD